MEQDVGRIGDADRVLSPSATEPVCAVSAHSGDAPLRERPSAHGAILGEALSALAQAGAVGTDLLSGMCATCAFRDGCMTNQMAATGQIALNCALGIDQDDFGCHHGLRSGEPTKLCAGWAAARRTPFKVVKATLATVKTRLDALGPDQIRAEFDAWAAEVDPQSQMDDYHRARLYARRDSDTHRMAATAQTGAVRSMGSAVPERQSPDPSHQPETPHAG